MRRTFDRAGGAILVLAAGAALASACIFSFPEVSLEGGGGSGTGGDGGQGALGGQGGDGGQGGATDGGGGQGPMGCVDGASEIFFQMRPELNPDAAVFLTGVRFSDTGLLVGGNFERGMFIGGQPIEPVNPFRGHGFVANVTAAGVQTLVGYTKECGDPSNGSPYIGRHLALLDDDPVMTGAFGFLPEALPDPGTFAGFGVPDPCVNEYGNPTATGNLGPYIVRYNLDDIANPDVRVDQGPRNSVALGVATYGGGAAILGMTATPAWDYPTAPPGPSGYSWYVTRFDAALDPIEPTATLMFGDPAYDTSNPEADGGDIALSIEGELWVTGRDCPEGTGCHLTVRAGDSLGFLLNVGAPEPVTAPSKGTVITVFGDTVLVGVTVEGSITLSDTGTGTETLTASPGESDTFVVALERETRLLRWSAKVGGGDAFDEPRAIAAVLDDCGGTVYVVGCANGELDCNPYPPGENATRAYVAALSLETGVERWRKDYEAVPGDFELPLFANAEDVIVGDDELFLAITYAGSLEEVGGASLRTPSAQANGLNLKTGAVLRLGLQ